MSDDDTAATLQFFGGAGTVTGSKHLITACGRRVLLDCGLFQGKKELRRRNWDTPPFNPSLIDAVVLSHAHIDHTGYLPLLVRRGFRGPVFCTPATRSLLKIILPDAAHIQEEQAAYANRKGFSKHHPAEPLYTQRDVEQALRLLEPKMYGESFTVAESIAVRYRRAGHILGSATVELTIDGHEPLTVVFSGDLGRWGRPMIRDPELVPYADVLLLESTYGNRVHPAEDASDNLARVINDGVERGGVILVPAFAVGRTQELIWRIRELEELNRIPRLPVYIDSPMALNATEIFCQHPEDHAIDMKLLMDEHKCPLCCRPYHLIRTAKESKTLNDIDGPAIIIASSGMATAGRIVHHLSRRLSDERTTVMLTGFQAIGTRGRSLQDGAQYARMHGRDVPVRATVEVISGLSGHADKNEILRWLRGFGVPPRRTWLVHGEPPAACELQEFIRIELGWNVEIAADQQVCEINTRFAKWDGAPRID